MNRNIKFVATDGDYRLEIIAKLSKKYANDFDFRRLTVKITNALYEVCRVYYDVTEIKLR